MKKVISLILCFVICFSVFNITAVVSSAFDYDVTNLISVNPSDFYDDKVTYNIKLASGLKSFVGTSVIAEYDDSVLEVVEDESGDACTLSTTGSKVSNYTGEFAKGHVKNQNGKYSFAFMSSGGATTTSKAIFTITFKVIDETRPETTVKFYCRELTTLDGNDANDITRQDPEQCFAQITTSTLNTPSFKSVSSVDNGIKLTWDEITGAESYAVLRKDAESAWETVGNVDAPDTEFIDEFVVCGELYVYSLKAVNNYGESGYNSAGVNGAFAEKPVVKTENGNKLIKVLWNGIDGVDGYRVYRREKGAEKWTKIATPDYSVTSYEDKNIVSGTVYEYDVNSYVKTFESQIKDNGKEAIYVDFPEITKIFNNSTGITFEWEAVEAATTYTVYRMGEEDEGYSILGTIDASLGSQFTDRTAVTGEGYKYAVKASCPNGDSGRCETEEFFVRVASTGIKEIENTEEGIYIEWQGLLNVDGYNVYRKEQNSVIWNYVASVDIENNNYTDTTAKSGKTYEYAVTAFVGNCEGYTGTTSGEFYYIKAPACVAENKERGVSLSWQLSDGAESYIIYRTDEGGIPEQLAEVEESPYVDTTAVNGETYTYRIVAVGTKGSSPKGVKSEPVCRMPAPENFNVSVVATGVKITWDSVDVAECYNIYRRTATGTYEKIATESNELSFIDTTVDSNKKYQYKICASFNGLEGVFTNDSSFIIYLVAPATVKAEIASNGIKVSWSKVDGASKYRVYKNDEKLTDTTNLNFVSGSLKSGTEYTYYVRPIGADGSLGGISKTVSCVYMTAPKITVANGLTGVTVTVTKVSGASYYEISRKESSAKSWTSLEDLDNTETTFTDTTAVSGKTYNYKVVAVSENSRSAETVSESLKYIAATKITSVATASTGIKVSWSKVSGASGYYLYRKTESGSWSKIKTTSSTSYTDTGAKKGTVYIYTVRPYSDSVTAAACSSVKAVRLVATTVKVSNANGYVNVTWSAVSGAAGYTVYRKTGSGSWTALDKVGASVKSYKDTTAKSGTKYYYTAKAYYGSCQGLYKSSSAIKYLSTPKLVSTTSVSSGITLKWEKVTGATGYYVYRKTSGGSYSRIATISKNSTVTYTDKKATKGTKYIYTVKAYSGTYVSAVPSGISGVKK